MKDDHGKDPDTITSNFKILKKCQSKLDCLIFEMLFIRDLKPTLNKQSDSIRAKLFNYFTFKIPFIFFSAPYFIIHVATFLYCFYVNILELLVSISLVFSQLKISTMVIVLAAHPELEDDHWTVETSFIHFYNHKELSFEK